MVVLKLTRDEARSVEVYFFDFLDHYCKMRKQDATGTDEKYLQIVIMDLYYQVKKIFIKRLASQAKKLTLKFTSSQAIILHKLLIALPLDSNNVWLVQLRQLISNLIYTEISKLFKTEGPG